MPIYLMAALMQASILLALKRFNGMTLYVLPLQKEDLNVNEEEYKNFLQRPPY